MEEPASSTSTISSLAQQIEAEPSSTSISSTCTAQGPNGNNGYNIEEANPAVVTITGPLHHVIQPAYKLIRGQGAENEGFRSSSRAIGCVKGIDIEQVQVVFTLTNSSQRPANANSIRPPQNHVHIIDISEDEMQRLEHRTQLYHAARTGDQNRAKEILGEGQERSALLSSPVLSVTKETVLHIAAGAKQVEFAEMLLQEPGIDEFINAQDEKGNTALCTAAAAGASEIVRKLWNREPKLLFTPGGDKMTPAYMAATFGHGAIASELYSEGINRQRPMRDEDKIFLFFICIHNELFDLALTLLKDSPGLKLDCKRDYNSETALHVLARKTSAFSSQHQGIWSKLVNGCLHLTSSSNTRSLQTQASEFLLELLRQLSRRQTNVFQDVIRRPRHLLFEAAALGNFNFLDSLIRSFPDLVWEDDGEGKFIFHTAILNRHMDIFKLIDETGLVKNVLQGWEDESTGDNILHFAAKLPPKDILNSKNSAAGEALQMQKEVLLFKGLEQFVPAFNRNKRNFRGKTPKQVFTLEHEDLMKGGEKWMKKNASYCLLVATLIVTVVFPAAFTPPGGNNDTNPESSKHHPKEELIILSITNAIAMGASTMSIIMFFSLLISRYAEDDFMSSLPWRFKMGLVSLIVSLVSMMVSFCIATFVTYVHHGSTGSRSIIVSAQIVAGISIIVFLIYPLLREIYSAKLSLP
ncbi:hypothetical protein L484_005979 [Morus notabilis]|uniref:PGG domain-containing protein n=1 Tax=Morus notabilis TaxID=981085 RepID=W9S3H7_9ROSA|nr:hypothetical protein L484_005979 [Morus notabilis]